MTATRPQPARAAPARVEVIDNWHVDWPRALAHLDRLERREQLGIDLDGWLGARRSLLVAFVNNEPAGHLCFRVEPVVNPVNAQQRPQIEAMVESTAVDDLYDVRVISEQLQQAARDRAQILNCVRFQVP